MGGPPQVIMTYGKGARKNSGLFQKYFTEHHITYIPSRGHPVFADRMIRTFRGVLDKRTKPDEQWTAFTNQYFQHITNLVCSFHSRIYTK